MIDELYEEAIKAYQTCVVRVLAARPTEELHVLSLAKFWDSVGKEHWVSLSQLMSTPVDELFMRNLFKLGSILKSLYAFAYMNIPSQAPDPINTISLNDVINSTFAMGYASYKMILLHSTATSIMLPASFLLSELNVIFSAISELYTMISSLVEFAPVATVEEGGAGE